MQILHYQGLPDIHWHEKECSRSVRLKLNTQGLFILTASRHVSRSFIDDFIEKNRTWILKMQRQNAFEKRQHAQLSNDQFFFRGKWVKLIHDQSLLFSCREENDVLYFGGDIERRDVTIRHYVKLCAQRELPERLFIFAHQLGYKDRIETVRITDTVSRWGSCSTSGTVSLSFRLVLMPDFVRDYILIHELVHFAHMNHSATFYQEIARHCPSYQLAHKWLKNSAYLVKNI